MVVLDSCPKHNMVAYLEKTEGNAEFHEFWMSAKSKIINNVRYITAKVAGKPLSISEASIRSDLLFDDIDGIDSLPNQAIFDAIQLMGYEEDLTVLTFNKALHLDAKKKFVMYPRFISIFLDKQLMHVPVPLDHFPVNALTSKVFSFMVKKGKHFSGKVTPLFDSMLVQSTEDEGATSERPSDPQPTSSPPHLGEANIEPRSDPSPRPSPTTYIPDSIPEVSGGNQGGQSSSDRSLSGNEGGMTLQSDQMLRCSKPVITHHRALDEKKKVLKKKRMQKESVSKQGRKSAKAEPSVPKDPMFDDLDGLDYMETKAYTKDGVSTDRHKVSTEATVNTDKQKTTLTTPTPTSTTFGDDETIAQVLITISQNKEKLKEKEKGVELRDVEKSEKPRSTSTRSVLILKPLPKIDPKDKGKKRIEEDDESGTESDEVTTAEKKFQQLTADEELARKIQED
ncbi:hypothetical protein Tco_1152493 [Tanacetum coccineum]